MTKLISIETITSVVKREDTSNPMDIVTLGTGEINVANRDDADVARDKVGDKVLVLRPGLILPERILRNNGLWDEEKGKGISVMKGSKNNRTAVIKIAGMPSEVMLVRIEQIASEEGDSYFIDFDDNEERIIFNEDSDIANLLGIEEWVNPNQK